MLNEELRSSGTPTGIAGIRATSLRRGCEAGASSACAAADEAEAEAVEWARERAQYVDGQLMDPLFFPLSGMFIGGGPGGALSPDMLLGGLHLFMFIGPVELTATIGYASFAGAPPRALQSEGLTATFRGGLTFLSWPRRDRNRFSWINLSAGVATFPLTMTDGVTASEGFEISPGDVGPYVALTSHIGCFFYARLDVTVLVAGEHELPPIVGLSFGVSNRIMDWSYHCTSGDGPNAPGWNLD